ncbi:MAG: hypothetical protein RLY14_1877 [Planctomycetota bacterium]|jgi:hypothetical protein
MKGGRKTGVGIVDYGSLPVVEEAITILDCSFVNCIASPDPSVRTGSSSVHGVKK